MEEEERPHLYPNKRPKPSSPSPSPPPGGKGKGKMEETARDENGDFRDPMPVESQERTCGICFTEEGRSIRGLIDSCDHYFCFVCIMEWGKIESRCPLCKQRFGSIRRPTVRGLFSVERVVHVPARDQIHHLYGNATGESDLYSDTSCTECHSSTDDYLLLLCDLCDSASHTYCVGLGYSVPEGDWYCHDCTILRGEHIKVQDGDNCSSEHHLENNSLLPTYKVVCGGTGDEVDGLENAEQIVPGIVRNEPEDGAPNPTERNSLSNDVHTEERSSVLDLGARTLNQCRNLHLHIKVLRENWSALQSGSMGFKTSLVSSDSMIGNSNNRITLSASGHQDCQSSANYQAPTSGSSASSMVNSCTNSYDVDRAWKMLEVAKTMQSVKSSTEARKPPGKRIICEKKIQHKKQYIVERKYQNSSVNHGGFKDKTNENRWFGCAGSEKHPGNKLSETGKGRFKHHNIEKPRSGYCLMDEICQSDEGSSMSYVSQNLKSNQEACHRNERIGPLHGMYDISRSGTIKDVPAFSGPSEHVQVRAFDLVGEKEAVTGVGFNTSLKDMNLVVRENADENSTRCCGSAKNEVQSLVKLNLKLQSRSSHLGAEKFKEIARVATHTVLAACGLDHSKLKARPFPSTICWHSDQTKLLRRSNLMPDSCRECFFSFVRDVVGSVAAEKTSAPNAS